MTWTGHSAIKVTRTPLGNPLELRHARLGPGRVRRAGDCRAGDLLGWGGGHSIRTDFGVATYSNYRKFQTAGRVCFGEPE